jgi:hypothetical protein
MFTSSVVTAECVACMLEIRSSNRIYKRKLFKKGPPVRQDEDGSTSLKVQLRKYRKIL